MPDHNFILKKKKSTLGTVIFWDIGAPISQQDLTPETRAILVIFPKTKAGDILQVKNCQVVSHNELRRSLRS